MTNSNWTGRTARTLDQALGCTGHAIEIYRTPPLRRFFYALIRHGWAIAVLCIAALVLSGCSSDIDTAIAVHADLADAIAQAAKEAGR
jgi:dTDP-4-dehydrorhamnose reductase